MMGYWVGKAESGPSYEKMLNPNFVMMVTWQLFSAFDLKILHQNKNTISSYSGFFIYPLKLSGFLKY